jgi:ATP-dependent Lon protease
MKKFEENSMPEDTFPALPLRDIVVFPHMVVPLFVGRERSIKAIESAMSLNQKIFLVAQKTSAEEEPTVDNIARTGTVATILQLIRLPDGTLKILVEGLHRVHVQDFIDGYPFIAVKIEFLEEKSLSAAQQEPMVRSLLGLFDQYVKLNKKIPPEIFVSLSSIHDPGRLVDTITAHMVLKIEDRQKILEEADLRKRYERLMKILDQEIELFQVEKKIRSRVKTQIEKNQKEYYLTEQLKAIRKELDETNETYNEIESLEKKIKAAHMSKEAQEVAMKELGKLKAMPAMSAESTVSRNYIDALISIPWRKISTVNRDLLKAEKVLDNDHYGLDKVKERILEYLAVQSRVDKIKGPILCLVGPPGVGKTSLGESIAKATGREFIRVALGGVRDEAEIRGHRRTYIGAMPGKIIQKLTKVKVKNPLFLLDEIDKMTSDSRGDPSSALLEVLDPEQNHAFNDHYLEVDYDLSDVMFVATANSLNIPDPLLDRMEVIRLAGYTEDEKLSIAKKYLFPKHVKLSGLKKSELKMTDKALLSIIQFYTREAGVRGLEREISKICRKVVKALLLSKDLKSVEVSHQNLDDYLAVPRYRHGSVEAINEIGQVNGLAWTEVGGELLKVETMAVPGKGNILRTGKLGDVMLESIQAAMTVVRSRAKALGIPEDFHEKTDIHVHVPEGATPKDGPSAGIAMCTALVSALTGIPVRSDVAMTGEITLRGEVLPIGGLKEKLLAAHRGGIKTVLIPIENERDLKDIPANVKKDLVIKPVRWIDQVLVEALETPINCHTSFSQNTPVRVTSDFKASIPA